MEEIARANVPSDESWESVMYFSDDAGVILLYDEDRVQYNFSVYEKKTEWISWGYFLRFMSVGARIYSSNSVMKYGYDGEHIVYVSMNEQKIQKIKAWDENDVLSMEVDSQKPFVVLLPKRYDNVKYYNQDENEITDVDEIFG